MRRRESFLATAAIVTLLSVACGSGDAATLHLDPNRSRSTSDGGTSDGGTSGGGTSGSGTSDECTSNADCGTEAPFCSDGGCVECMAGIQCDAAETCNPSTGECTPTCTEAADCAGEDATQCDVAAGYCVECLDSAHCADGDRNACLTSGGICVECLSDADCTDPENPGCSLAEHRCDACSNDQHCESGKICNVQEGQCEG
jgi:hypothetical protein